MQEKIYVAGPMRGVPQFNVPLFHFASKMLRDRGHFVVSPAEADAPEIQAMALASLDGVFTPEMKTHETMGEILGRDVRLVIDEIDTVVFLPGWARSTGAKLEAFVGLLHRKKFGDFETHSHTGYVQVAAEHVAYVLRETLR